MARNMVSAVFDERSDAEDAIRRLRDAGFSDVEISAVYADTTGAAATPGTYDARVERTEGDDDVGPGGGAVAGAVTGGLIWLAAGPLGALVGAVGGAVVGAVTAGLIDLGAPEEEARWYGEEVERGRTLVIVDAGTRTQVARDILIDEGGRMRDMGSDYGAGTSGLGGTAGTSGTTGMGGTGTIGTTRGAGTRDTYGTRDVDHSAHRPGDECESCGYGRRV